jgi:pilus assembly protein CpaC
MHRSIRVPYPTLTALVVLLSSLASPLARAQDQPPPGAIKALIVPIGSSKRLQMTTKKPMSKVVNEKENVARVQAVVDDPTTIVVTGLEAGLTRIVLADNSTPPNQEVYDVVVQVDIEYLRSVLKRTVPTANVEPIPGPNNTLVLHGWVEHAEDVEIIMTAARAAVGSSVTNALRVAGVQQVQLCVTVAKVSRSQLRRMAFNFLTDTKNTFFGSFVGQAATLPTSVGVGSAQLNVAASGVALSGVPGAPNGAGTNLFFGVIHQSWGLLTFLQALKDESVVKTLASPVLVTESGRPASFLSGGEQAIPIPAGLGQVGVQFEEFGTRLNFLPIVKGGGKIHLEVEPEVSALDQAFGTSIQGTVVPGRTTQRVHTSVELEDGQTFVIGGLIERDITGNITKVPILGELPFIGAAFSSKGFTELETELVILVTPHLVDAQSCDQLVKLLPGQETRNPDDFELFLENILEAPRGQREICFPRGYVPAYKNGPSAGRYPCGLNGGCNSCGSGGCATGGCGTAPGSTLLPGASLTSPAGSVAPNMVGNEARKSSPLPSQATLPMTGTKDMPAGLTPAGDNDAEKPAADDLPTAAPAVDVSQPADLPPSLDEKPRDDKTGNPDKP